MIEYDLGNKPELFAYTKRAAYEASKTGQDIPHPNTLAKTGEEAMNAKTAAHWGSVYKNEVLSNTEKGRIKSNRPLWSLPREAYTSKRGGFETEATSQYGKQGSNPRDKLPASATKMSNTVHENNMGTTKTGAHIPGYNGYIPRSDFNDRANTQAKLQGDSGYACRNTIVKQNIVENYQVKLPGYSGHKPMSTINDRGSCRPNCLNVNGESF